MSLLVVGSVALDSVETPFGKKDDVLGGSASYFSTSSSFFTPVKMAAVVGEDFPATYLDFFRSRGIDLDGVSRTAGKTFRWKGRYTHQLNEAHTLDTQLNVFEHFSPEMPATYRSADYVFLGNIHPALQSRVLDQITKPKLVAADTMNFWIQGEREKLLATLRRVDLLFVNDAEARQLSGEHNIVKAAKAILSMGPSRVVIKRGEYGALLFDAQHIFSCPAFPLLDVFDPTGAGDTFAGGFMGFVTRKKAITAETLRQGMICGAVMASFTCEKFSLERLVELNMADIERRYSEFKSLTHFDDWSSAL